MFEVSFPLEGIRLAEHAHGHVGWLATAALLHPAIVLRRPRRRAHLAVALSSALVTLAGAWGVALYDEYRARIKQSIFIHAPSIGWLFERKEHLAFGAVVMAWAGALTYFAAARSDDAMALPLRRASHYAFVTSFVFALVTAALGTVVASYKTF